MAKVQANKDMFFFELSSKPNVDVVVITVSMWKNIILKNLHF